jgi:radical SAM superfamily enzyme YgiQ (UPF0313 family)
MVDVLLTHSYHLFFDRKQARKMKPYPPLGTLYAAALLREKGFSVALFDSMLENPEEGFERVLAKHQPRIVVVYEDNFNFLTKMCLTRMREVAYAMLEQSKAVGAITVVNGSDATDHLSDYLRRGFDYLLVGEAEWTLLELVQRLLCTPTSPVNDIRGLAYLDPPGQRIVQTAPRGLMPCLDDLPFPAWDLIDGDRYRSVWSQAHGYFSMNMVSSRGCPYHCNWCAKPIYGTSYNARSPEKVAEEMRLLKDTFNPQHLWFADDIFALRPRWTERFAQAVQELDAGIPFQMQSRVDLITSGTASDLARAGCAEVWMGAESGSQKILNAMEKGSQVEQILQARHNLKAAGIRACFFLQFGYPGETWEDIRSTINLVRRARPDDIGVSVSYPLPGTKFHSMVQAQLQTKTNWEDSEDLAMMFKGIYTDDFYHALHDALHLEVDLTKVPVSGNGNGNKRTAAEGTGRNRSQELASLWARVAELESCCRNASQESGGSSQNCEVF